MSRCCCIDKTLFLIFYNLLCCSHWLLLRGFEPHKAGRWFLGAPSSHPPCLAAGFLYLQKKPAFIVVCMRSNRQNHEHWILFLTVLLYVPCRLFFFNSFQFLLCNLRNINQLPNKSIKLGLN